MCWWRPGEAQPETHAFCNGSSVDVPQSVMRTDSEVLLYFDIRATLADGEMVYGSPNNVVLIEGYK